MYHRGTLEEFNIWHESVKLAYGIPPAGIIGYINEQPAPNNQRTIAYVRACQNPNGNNDYIWPYEAYPDPNKTKLSQEDINNPEWLKLIVHSY